MPTLKYLEYSFDCTTAIKGDDYIRLLDENGVLIASFEGIADFSVFTLVNGEYTAPTAPGECYVAVIRDDGTIAKGGHRCSCKHTLEGIGCHLGHESPETVTGRFLQTLAHECHTVEEHCKSTQYGKHVKNSCHMDF